MEIVWPGIDEGTDADGTDEAQLSENGLDELGMMSDEVLLLTWDKTLAACACVGNVKKQ